MLPWYGAEIRSSLRPPGNVDGKCPPQGRLDAAIVVRSRSVPALRTTGPGSPETRPASAAGCQRSVSSARRGADASRFVVIEYRSHITILVAIQRLQHSTEVLRLRRTRTCRCSSLREGESQQARAQQHKAGCGQREESVGDQIVIAHDTPATLDARPNLLKLSEHASWKEVMRLSAFGAQTTQGSRP
jgi:hypothetical protein